MKARISGIKVILRSYGIEFVLEVYETNPKALLYIKGYKRYFDSDKEKARRFYDKWSALTNKLNIREIRLQSLNHTKSPVEIDAQEFRYYVNALCAKHKQLDNFFARMEEDTRMGAAEYKERISKKYKRLL